MIYISCSFLDLKSVIYILQSISVLRKEILFNRLHLLPDQNWQYEERQFLASATHAIVFLTENYIESPACQEQLRYLSAKNIPTIALLLSNVRLSDELLTANFVEILDLHKFKSIDEIEIALVRIFETANIPLTNTIISERVHYAQDLILQIEETLVQTSCIQFFPRDMREQIATRGYYTGLVNQRQFNIVVDEEMLAIEDLRGLIEIQPYILIRSASSQELNTLLSILCLMSVHEYKAEQHDILPILLDADALNPDSTVEEWLHEAWQLQHDCNAWITSKPIRLYANLNQLPQQMVISIIEKLTDFCMKHDNCSFVACSSAIQNINLDLTSLVIVQPTPLPITTLPEIAKAHGIKNIESYFNYQSHEAKTICLSYDHLNLLIEYALAFDGDLPLCRIPIHLVRGVIDRRWQTAFASIALPVDLDGFINALIYLAWQFTLKPDDNYMTLEEATRCIGDEALLTLASELRILRLDNASISFEDAMIQTHLAAYYLLDDGIYKHLRKPVFDDQHSRQQSPLDKVVSACFHIVEPERYSELVELIGEIDPFVALEFAKQDTQLLKQYLPDIVQKLYALQLKNPTARREVEKVLTQLSLRSEVIICVMQLLRHVQRSEQPWLLSVLQDIPTSVPDTVIEEVYNLDRDFADSRTDLLLDYPDTQWLVYLSHLVNHFDPHIQRNAIFLAGGLKDKAFLPFFYDLIHSETHSIINLTIESAREISDSINVLEHILASIADSDFDVNFVSNILIHWQRALSSWLLKNLNFTDKTQLREWCGLMINMPESQLYTTTKTVIAEHIAGQVHSTLQYNIEDDHMSRFIERLRQQIDHVQDSNVLETLLHDLSSRFGDEAVTAESVNQANVETPQPLVDVLSVTHLPDDIAEMLADADWVIRHRALLRLSTQLQSVHYDIIFALARYDEDVQVRLTALDIAQHLEVKIDIHALFYDALSDEDLTIIDAATEYFKQQQAIDTPDMIELLYHDNPATVGAAIEILAVHRDNDALIALQALANDDRKAWMDEFTIGEHAQKLIAVMTSGTSEAPLKEDELESSLPIPTSTTDDLAYRTKQAKRKYSPEQKIRLSLIALANDDREMSQRAAKYLRKISEQYAETKTPAMVKMLEAHLQHSNWTVRWAVVEALAWIKSNDSIQHIEVLLHDDVWMVQVASIRSLVELNATESAHNIAELLYHSNSAVAEVAAEALGTLQNSEVFDALQKCLIVEDEFVRFSVIQAMFQLSPEQTIPDLIALLADPYGHIRWFAARALSENPPLQALPHFGELLTDYSRPIWEKKSISDFALKGLLQLDTPESHTIISNWYSHQGKKD